MLSLWLACFVSQVAESGRGPELEPLSPSAQLVSRTSEGGLVDQLLEYGTSFAEQLRVDTIGAFQAGAILQAFARSELEGCQAGPYLLQLATVQRAGAFLDHGVEPFAAVVHEHVDFEQTAHVVAEAHFDGGYFGVWAP